MFADARYSSTTPPKLLFRPHDEAPRNTPDDLMIVFLPALADAAERVCAEVRPPPARTGSVAITPAESTASTTASGCGLRVPIEPRNFDDPGSAS
jgi:hypothetical protein